MIDRVRGWWKSLRGGDVIVADIGENSQGTAVGKNIIQIGKLSVPVLPLLLMLLAIVSIGGYLMWTLRPEPKVEKMQGQFNILVAQFGQIGMDGQVDYSEDGANLSRWMYESLDKEFDQADIGIAVDIWHDSRRDIGAEIGIIQGNTAEARRNEAENIAKSVNAHLVIYGNLIASDDMDEFVPEFYVTELTDMPDLVGSHQLGAAIPVNLPIDTLATSFQLNSKIQARARVLTLFTLGLVWESVDKDRALAFFNQAEQVDGWMNNEGREILYHFIGREALLLWEKGEDKEQETLEAFQTAIALNPEYGRAYIGLGNSYRLKAEKQYETLRANLLAGTSPLTSVEAAELADEFLKNIALAEDYYQRALDLSPKNTLDQVELKAYLGLGSTYNRLGGLYTWLQDYDAALDYFNQALMVNLNAWNTAEQDDARHLGLAQFGIGLAYHQAAYIYQIKGQPVESLAAYESAISAYGECVTKADEKPEDWFLQSLKDESCNPSLEAVQAALNDIEGAIP